MELERVKQLASDLLEVFKYEPMLHNWKFEFDNAKSRVGHCSYRKKIITISKNYVPLLDEQEVTDTLLHEIAHALVGRRQCHNHVWRQKAIQIGCNGQRLYLGEARVEAKYKGTCPTCGRVIKRHRRKRISCGRCSRKFDTKHLFVWTLNS